MRPTPSPLPESFDQEFVQTQLALIHQIAATTAIDIHRTLDVDTPSPRIVQACTQYRDSLPAGAKCEIDPQNPLCVVVELPGGNRYRWHMQGDQIVTQFPVIAPHGDPSMYALENEVMLYLCSPDETLLDDAQHSMQELVLAEQIAREIESQLGTGWQADKDPQINSVILKKNGTPCARIHQQRNGEFVIRYREKQNADPAVYTLQNVHIDIVPNLESASEVLKNRFQ